MFEFMQQGLREHDRDWIKTVMALKNTSVIRINPALDAFCPQCGLILITNHWSSMHSQPDKETLIYGCCRGGADILA